MSKVNLNVSGLDDMTRIEMKSIDGGTEIGYFLGYYITKGLKAIGEVVADVAETLAEKNPVNGDNVTILCK